MVSAHVGFPDSVDSEPGTSPEGHEEACARNDHHSRRAPARKADCETDGMFQAANTYTLQSPPGSNNRVVKGILPGCSPKYHEPHFLVHARRDCGRPYLGASVLNRRSVADAPKPDLI